jgi:hypothetical protein
MKELFKDQIIKVNPGKGRGRVRLLDIKELTTGVFS